MSYPPPPGTSSLPARPPPSKSGFKPAFTPSSVQQRQQAAGPTTYTYPHRSAAGAPQPSSYGLGVYPGAAPGVSTSAPAYPNGPQQTTSTKGYGQQATGYGQHSYSPAPQIRNPFQQPGNPAAAAASATASGVHGAGSEYDAEMAAQIAQWQSAYLPREPGAKDAKGNVIDAASVVAAAATAPKMPEISVAEANPDKTVVRHGGGKKWTDETLLEWDPTHLRLFVGNLGGETTDDALLKAFSRWASVQKARVIRDKRTNKSKGYGFVSFSDADDFFQAAKEMNNKYIQNRPVTVRKANTDIKVTNVKDKNNRGKNNNNRNRNGGGGHGSQGKSGGYDANLGPRSSAGVTKPGQKTKNGLRLLG